MSPAVRRQQSSPRQRRSQGTRAIAFYRGNGDFHNPFLHETVDGDAIRILPETVQDFTGILSSPEAIRKDNFGIAIELIH